MATIPTQNRGTWGWSDSVRRSDMTPTIASRPFSNSVSGFQKPWIYPSSLGFAAVPRNAKLATATERPTLSWNWVLMEFPVITSSITAEVKPIIAARPFMRSAIERKSLGRSTGLSGGALTEEVVFFTVLVFFADLLGARAGFVDAWIRRLIYA